MLLLRGGGKKSRNAGRRLRGGCGGGSAFANAAPYPDGGNASTDLANFAGRPTFSTTQVGGSGVDVFPNNSVGFNPSNPGVLKDIAAFGGSYFPASFLNTGNNADLSRGGNNFVGGGRSKRSRKGGRRSNKNKKGGRKSRCSKGGMRKWRGKGCSKKRGGNSAVRFSRAGGTRKHKKQRGGLLFL
jgi:hypothetical protein